MTKREPFLRVVFEDSIEEFLHFIQLRMDASDSLDLHELVQELSRKQKETLWNKLKDLLAKVLLDNPIDEWQRINDDSMETEKDAMQKQTIAVIQGVATIVTASIPTLEENIDIKALLECAMILNGILSALPDSESSLLRTIQQLYLSWWEKGLEGKEQIGKTAFLMLLKNLERKIVLEEDITHIWNLHQTLLYFDYDSEESNEIKDLLLQCFMITSYIKNEEGKRFLSFLFTWNINFIRMIHETIKNQLPYFSRSLMDHVAEIYFRAWKKSSGEILEVIEYNCIQDFMHHAIHLPQMSPLCTKVRKVVSYFHKQSKCRQGVEEVLYRLYKPILWRALKARNSEIRSNAAFLFGDAFPILDPNFDFSVMKNEIQRQFNELFTILGDPHPLVRSTGVFGVSKIAFKYWEMIPPSVLAEFLKLLIEEIAFDATSSDVRCAVFKCLPLILDNRLSHPLLEQLLPTLKYNLHDNSEKVRVAFVDLLLKIKATKAGKFWKICPVDHLLTRLEIDSRPVSRRLVNLLISSFMPINQPEVWIERCVALIQLNASAARTFYQYIDVYTSSTNIAKLMLSIRNCLNSCIQQQLQKSENGVEHSENETMNVADKVLSVGDIPIMSSLLEIIVILWRSIQKALDCNEKGKEFFVQKFASVLPKYFKIFKDDRCVSPIIILASFISPTAIPTFSCSVISKLKNLEDGVAEKKYSILLDCLCRWGKLGHILELIYDWIMAEPRKRKTNKHQRRLQIQEAHDPKPELALDYLQYLLTHYMNQNCLLSLSTETLNQLLKALEYGKDALDFYIQGSNLAYPGLYQATALRAFSLYCRLNIHLLHKFASEEQDYLSALKKTGTWIENRILPPFLVEKTSSETSQLVIQTYLAVCQDLIAIGLSDFEFQASLLNLAFRIIYKGKGSIFIPMLLSILREIVEASLAACDIVNADCIRELLNSVQKLFQKILESMALSLRGQQEEGIQLIHSAKEPLRKFVLIVQSYMLIFPSLHQEVISSLLAAVVVEINCNLKKKVSNTEKLIRPKTFLNLPPLSRVLMFTVNKSANAVRSFLKELLKYIESEESEGIMSLTTCMYIVALIKGKQKPSYVKAITVTLQKKIMTYNEITKEGIERLLCDAALDTVDEMLDHGDKRIG